MVDDNWGTVEFGDSSSCDLTLYSSSLTSIARWLRAFDADFSVLEPEALRRECQAVADRHYAVCLRKQNCVICKAQKALESSLSEQD